MERAYQQLQVARSLVQHLALNAPEHLHHAIEALSQVLGHATDDLRQASQLRDVSH
jgi:hypothetical protein